MTGVGGRPEVVVEGSYDKETWTVLCLSRVGFGSVTVERTMAGGSGGGGGISLAVLANLIAIL